MTRTILPACFFLLMLSGCLELDGFLADELALDAYTLPGNTIASALIEQVAFDSEGATLQGFWVASNGTRPGLTILYCHGNRENIDHYWDRVLILHELGVNLFIFDYRGFGLSEGDFSEKAMLADGRAALDYVLSRPEADVDSLGLYGYSLGNVPAIYLAAEVLDPLFFVAEAPFASANSLAQGALNLPLPPRWITGESFDNADRIVAIDTPFLLFHGEDDDTVRYRDNGKVVYELAPEPKSLILVSGAGHNNIPQTMGIEAYLSALEDWITFSVDRSRE